MFTLENLQDDKSAVLFLKQIKPNTSIRILNLCRICVKNLANNKIDDDAAVDICDLIRMRHTLTGLYLGKKGITIDHNKIGDKGANEIGVVARTNESLTTLSLCKLKYKKKITTI